MESENHMGYQTEAQKQFFMDQWLGDLRAIMKKWVLISLQISEVSCRCSMPDLGG